MAVSRALHSSSWTGWGRRLHDRVRSERLELRKESLAAVPDALRRAPGNSYRSGIPVPRPQAPSPPQGHRAVQCSVKLYLVPPDGVRSCCEFAKDR